MFVYHGSDTIVDAPKIFAANRLLDFGNGFYVTTNEEQARKWADRVAHRNANFPAILNYYEFDRQRAEKELRIRTFDGASEEWLNFVCACRQGKTVEQYDIVVGPVADDRVYRVVILYENGDIDKETALRKLKTETLCDQILFHTPQSLTYLHFLRYEEVVYDG